ncbi:MAG: hypothetical protein ACREF8_02355 [Chthoniobacterales bacterium]
MFRDKRRKHRHYCATVTYASGETFARTYIDKDRADRFAERQRKSPVVVSASVREVNRP